MTIRLAHRAAPARDPAARGRAWLCPAILIRRQPSDRNSFWLSLVRKNSDSDHPAAESESRQPPMHQGERRLGVVMRLEYRFDSRADRHLLPRIAQQVAHHPNIVRMRQLDQRSDIGSVTRQRRMDRMPNALIAVDDPFA